MVGIGNERHCGLVGVPFRFWKKAQGIYVCVRVECVAIYQLPSVAVCRGDQQKCVILFMTLENTFMPPRKSIFLRCFKPIIVPINYPPPRNCGGCPCWRVIFPCWEWYPVLEAETISLLRNSPRSTSPNPSLHSIRLGIRLISFCTSEIGSSVVMPKSKRGNFDSDSAGKRNLRFPNPCRAWYVRSSEQIELPNH